MRKLNLLILIAFITFVCSCKKDNLDIPAKSNEEKSGGNRTLSSEVWVEQEGVTPYAAYEYQVGDQIFVDVSANFGALQSIGFPHIYTLSFYYSAIYPDSDAGVINHGLAYSHGDGGAYTKLSGAVATNQRTVYTVGDLINMFTVQAETKYVDAQAYSCKIKITTNP